MGRTRETIGWEMGEGRVGDSLRRWETVPPFIPLYFESQSVTVRDSCCLLLIFSLHTSAVRLTYIIKTVRPVDVEIMISFISLALHPSSQVIHETVSDKKESHLCWLNRCEHVF